MSLHPDLVRFARRLDTAGVITAEHSDHLCVRLPLLASVRVRYDGVRLALEPRFGVASRNQATISTFASVIAAILGMAFSGVSVPALVTAGTLGVLASAYDLMRYVITEGAITRVTALWTAPESREIAPALGEGPAMPLHAAPAQETLRVPRA
jgi:hypothetical protein